jgi:hypothetical protein
VKIEIDCSPEQMEVIADYFLEDKPLGMQPDERSWMLAQARKLNSAYRILSADLDEYNGKWILEVTDQPKTVTH